MTNEYPTVAAGWVAFLVFAISKFAPGADRGSVQ